MIKLTAVSGLKQKIGEWNENTKRIKVIIHSSIRGLNSRHSFFLFFVKKGDEQETWDLWFYICCGWRKYEIFKFHKSKELEYFVSFHLFLIYFPSNAQRERESKWRKLFWKMFCRFSQKRLVFPGGNSVLPFFFHPEKTQKLFADHDFMSSVLFIAFLCLNLFDRSFPKKQTQSSKRKFTHKKMCFSRFLPEFYTFTAAVENEIYYFISPNSHT